MRRREGAAARRAWAAALTCVALLGPPNAVNQAHAASPGLNYTPIFAIQGEGTASPLRGRQVDTQGVVTGVTPTGFYLQDPQGDGNPLTSDGIFVYTARWPAVATGECVRVQDARVEEFYAKTELNRAGRIEPAPGCGIGTIVPVAMPALRFDQAQAGPLEPLEGMLVHLPGSGAAVLGPTRRFASGEEEMAVLPARLRPYLEGPRLFHDDPAAQNALLFISNRLGSTLPAAAAGMHLAWPPIGLTAVLDYNFGKYQLLPLPGQLLWVQGDPPAWPVPAPVADDEFGICTFNLHGLGRGEAQFSDADAYAAALRVRAQVVAETLQGCTIIAVQETGTPDDAANLAGALAKFGLAYTAAALDGPASSDAAFPLTNSLLTHTDRVEVTYAALDQGCSVRDYDVLDPGACPPGQFPLFDRPPLVVRLSVTGTWEGAPVELWIINNHWKSKAGDEKANAVRRLAQARHVAARVQAIRAEEAGARIVVAGDLNDFYRAEAVAVFQTEVAPPLLHPFDWVPPHDRYTYIFNGAAQVLDHLLVSPNLGSQIARIQIVHGQAERPATGAAPAVSDHDPVVLIIRPDGAAGLGGSVAFGGVQVEAVDTQGAVVAQVVADAAGEYRLWDLPLGPVRVRFLPPPHVSLTPDELTWEVVPGYQTMAAPHAHHRTAQAAAALAVFTPELVARSPLGDRLLTP